MIAEERIDALIGRLYDAALAACQWQGVVDGFADLFCGSAVLFSQDMLRSGATIGAVSGLDPDAMHSYEAHYSCKKPWLSRIERAPPGSVVTLGSLIDEPSYRRSEYYNEFLAQLGAYYLIGAIIAKDGPTTTVATVIRPKRYEDFDGAEVAATRRLLPHIRRAVQMHRQLHAAELQRDGLARALETLAVGAILATADGRILFANRGAEAILRRGRGLGVVGGRLCAESTMLRERLLAMIRQAALTGADQGKHAGGALALPRRGEQPLSLLVCPLPLRHVEFGRSAPTALIFLAAPDRNTATSGEVLCRLYGLTPAEARLLDALLAGTSVNGYAELVGVSAATARTQLRALFAKTGTSRQADLVRVVLTNPIVRLAAKE